MSHSQFHLYKQFILRHAWLNLLDKHMTTGRINQVALCSFHYFSLFCFYLSLSFSPSFEGEREGEEKKKAQREKSEERHFNYWM